MHDIQNMQAQEFDQLVKRVGPIAPVSVAAGLVGISRQRVWQLVRAGKVRAWPVNGAAFVEVRLLTDRQVGDPGEGVQSRRR